ncbi:MAG: KEOPS complex subunit Pcc1 [Candidatus Bathyarchaeota archaeon]|nr:KEOPS complex subunit Pcc1 [Candidatus Bathyarchaeota archaeon]
MATSAKTTIRFKLKNQKQAATLLNALEPEVNSPLNRRTKISLAAKDAFLVLSVEAEDTVALRAALNAYLRWIGSTVSVLELVEQT